MRETLPRHQIIEYQRNEPFYAANARQKDADYIYIKNSHWHEELELAYCLQGNAVHYIDGEQVEAKPGRLIVTNCESVHRIDAKVGSVLEPDAPASIVLIIHNRFIEENFPEYRDFWFVNRDEEAPPEVRDIMLSFSRYAERKEHRPNEHLFMRGLLLQLLYFLYESGTVSRTDSASAARHEHVRVLKEILEYVEDHYAEPLAQADVAQEFYFSPQYFARYFKRCTGVTFTQHLTSYRLQQAKKDLLHTGKLVKDIALDNGFTDERSLINAFKRHYGVTPLQFRKAQTTNKKIN